MAVNRHSSSWISRVVRWFFIGVAGILLLLLIYIWITLSWTYSSGERAGYVQKFSRKGMISKTWEGELAMVSIPGTMPEKFYFTVRDDSIAALINSSMGRKVALHYEQHIGVPTTFFGETGYFVTEVKTLE